jgi:Tol biopolymer transport system component/C-terminal processing protease CtpA/Prc
MRKATLLFFYVLLFQFVFSQPGRTKSNEDANAGGPLWLRYPSISPDGRTVLFCFKGDIYKVSSEGGAAIPLTISESVEFSPVWSHDGQYIAFASNRYGNFDVFVMPAAGGEAKRLTWFSGWDIPTTFSPDDKEIIFVSNRQDLVTNVQFPDGGLTQLYSVPVNGGKASMFLPVPAIDATFSSDGSKLLFHDLKGYENDWRKHHTSSVTRDIWEYDLKTKKYTQLTTNKGEDRNAVFGENDNEFYYLSEQNGGSMNVYKSSLDNPSASVAVTSFKENPVRFLSRSKNNTLCFGYDGEVYLKKVNGDPQKLSVVIAEDGRMITDKTVPVNMGATEMQVSPNGKEIAFVVRGEIFVTSVDGGTTKRITNTPYQERSVSFSPDGRSLVYAAEPDSSWNIYTISIERKEEPYFYASTVLKPQTIVASKAEEFQPAYSPDGKEIAYLENRVVLKVINLESKQTRTILTADKNYSYADGDQYYRWSPDSKWFLVSFGQKERILSPEVGLVPASGQGPLTNLTLSGYDDFEPKWAMDGKMMIWGSTRDGAKVQAGYSVTMDVYAMFFTKESFDRFKLSKEDYALLKEQEDKDKEKSKDSSKIVKALGKKEKKGEKTITDTTEKKKDLLFDWENLTDRKMRITTHTSDLGDMELSKDGEKLYYMAHFEKGYDLWVTDLRKKDTRLLSKLSVKNPSLQISGDGKSLFLLAEGRIMKIDTESGKTDPVNISGEMTLDYAGEKEYIFNHSWRQIKEKFYVEDMQGVDWDHYYKVYRKFLPYINNNYDFAEMLSELLGELNASHTGCYYFGAPIPNGDRTAALGIYYDYDYKGRGLKIDEVVEDGPLDRAHSKIKAGDIIEEIDGSPITDTVDHYKYLNRKGGQLTLLSIYDPVTHTRWQETVKPIERQDENELKYQRWVKARRKEVDSLSGGRIGYIHVRAMDDESMRTVIEEALGRSLSKEALIIDTRFNGGGNIHEPLSDFLAGKKYIDIIPHGQYVGSEPYNKWYKPSVVLIGEANYSDAHLFPIAYKLKGIGKTIGMPIAGTGTFVWWEEQIDPTLVFGMPMGGWRTMDGNFAENHQMEPDIKVRLDYNIMTNGRDQQIEAAVAELLKK